MSWQDVLKLYESVDGNERIILPEAMKKATAGGPGSPDVQVRIARAAYRVKHEREVDYESEDKS